MTMPRWFAACAALLSASWALAQVPGKTYAQELVDRSLAQQQDLLVMAMQSTPPGQSQTMIIASNFGRLGRLADPDDLKLIRGGEMRVKPSADGKRLSIDLTLQDVVGNAVGSLGLVWPREPGQDEAALVARSLRLHDARGALIGTMNVGYRVQTGEDTQLWLAHALNLRPAIEQRIASAAALAELDP